MRAYLGVFQFNSRFQKNAAGVLDPLYKMLDHKAKRKKLAWTQEKVEAFERSKESLSESVNLAFFNNKKHISIFTDSSSTTISGVLCQTEKKLDGDTDFSKPGVDDREVIKLFSRPLKGNELEYAIFLKELIAVRDSLRQFHFLVYGREVTLFCDNQAVVKTLMLATDIELRARVHRIFVDILQYAPQAYYIRTEDNYLSDLLTRKSCFKETPLQPVVREAMGGIKEYFEQGENGNNLIGIIKSQQMSGVLKQIAQCQESDPWIKHTIKQEGNSALEIIRKELPEEGVSIYGDISTNNFRVLVPRQFVARVVKLIHNSHHSGRKRTISDIATKFVWPRMTRDVREVIKACDVCAKSKVYRHEQTELIKYVANPTKLSSIHVDYVGPLKPSHGKRHILVMKDRNTRWTVCIATTSQKTDELIRVFIEHWVRYHGVPIELTSDNAKNFKSKAFQDVLKVLGIKYRAINSYAPYENAMAERTNKLLATLIRTRSDTQNWATYLPLANMYLNSLVGPEGVSASQTVYGEQLIAPACQFFEKYPSEMDMSLEEYAKRMMKFYENFRTWPPKSQPGPRPQDIGLDGVTHVYVRIDKSRNKFDAIYEGPFLVTEMRRKSAKIVRNGKTVKICRNRLKPAHFLSLSLEPPRDWDEQDSRGTGPRRPHEMESEISSSSDSEDMQLQKDKGSRRPNKGRMTRRRESDPTWKAPRSIQNKVSGTLRRSSRVPRPRKWGE